MSDETTPGPDLREQAEDRADLAAALLALTRRAIADPGAILPRNRESGESVAEWGARAVMASVVQRELDWRDAEIDRLRALWADVAKIARHRKAEADGRRKHTEKLKAENEQLRKLVADYEDGITWHTSCLGCATLLDSCYAETMRAEQAEAAIARAKALAKDMRTWCSPHGIAALYADRIEEALAPPAPVETDAEFEARCEAALRKHQAEALTTGPDQAGCDCQAGIAEAGCPIHDQPGEAT